MLNIPKIFTQGGSAERSCVAVGLNALPAALKLSAFICLEPDGRVESEFEVSWS